MCIGVGIAGTSKLVTVAHPGIETERAAVGSVHQSGAQVYCLNFGYADCFYQNNFPLLRERITQLNRTLEREPTSQSKTFEV